MAKTLAGAHPSAMGMPFARCADMATGIGEVRVGISGWRYTPWRKVFYPPKLPQRQELAFASRQLATIEINGSFYSLQTPRVFPGLARRHAGRLRLSVKGPRYITHMLRLNDVRVPLSNFLASGVLALRAKLGAMLWRFPPQMTFKAERFEAFFALLPRSTRAALELAKAHDERLEGRSGLTTTSNRPMRHAVEIRHPSFVDPAFIALLRRHRIALVVADTAGRWPLVEDLTADFVYVRLHGDQELYASGYGDEALDAWAHRIDHWRRGGSAEGARLASARPGRRLARRDVFCYFDNDIKVHAPFDAARLAMRLGLTTGTAPPERRIARDLADT